MTTLILTIIILLAFLFEVLTDTYTQKRYYFEKVKANTLTYQYDKTIKKYQYLSHIMQIIMIITYAIFLSIVLKIRVDVFSSWLYTIKSTTLLFCIYTLARYCWFNMIYNKINKLPLFYLGDTDIFDKMTKWVCEKTKQPYDGWFKIVFSFVLPFLEVRVAYFGI